MELDVFNYVPQVNMWNYVIALLFGVPMVLFYLYAVGAMALFSKQFVGFPYEIFSITSNGLIGIIGFHFYILNVGTLGRIEPMTKVLNCTQPKDEVCAISTRLFIVYATFSAIRFLCWYFEFLVSFLFIMFFQHYRRIMIALRYACHTLTLSTSLVTLVLVTIDVFPTEQLYTSDLIKPFIVQLIVLFYVLLSYGLIAHSRLYRVRF